MNIRNTVKRVVYRLTKIPYIGRLVQITVKRFGRPIQIALIDWGAFGKTKRKLQAVSDGYGAAIRGMEHAIRRHEDVLFNALSFSNNGSTIQHSALKTNNNTFVELKAIFAGYGAAIRGLENAIRRHDIQLSNLESHSIKEIPFEAKQNYKTKESTSTQKIESRFINLVKINCTGLKKLNLGCGHLAKEDFINVDVRELPGVDLISDVRSLPFDKQTIDTIYTAHLVELFPEQVLREVVIPHWLALLKPEGHLIIVAADAQAMMDGYARGEFSFEELREITFGRQKYAGDFHFTMFSPEIAVKLLQESGFASVTIVASGRRNGACFEFEIQAKKSSMQAC